MKGNIRVTVWNEYRHNAVRWAAPVSVHGFREMPQAPHVREPMEKFEIAD